jgi:hypothetical protein
VLLSQAAVVVYRLGRVESVNRAVAARIGNDDLSVEPW